MISRRFKVVFGGLGHFQSAFVLTKEALKNDDTIDIIQCTAESIETEITDADVVIPFMVRINEQTLRLAPKLKMIMQYGVGVEGVDIEAASKKKVWVCNIQSGDCSNDKSSAEHAIYLALAVCRDQKAMQDSLLAGRLGCPTGRSFFGANALIYGFGGIGRQVAKRLKAFDMQISAVTRTLPAPIESDYYKNYLSELCATAEFPRLAATADIVFICCSQNSSNMGLVNKIFLSHLKDSAIIINVARGGLLNYPDVLEALDSGKLHGLGIDVYHTEPFPSPLDDPFLSHPRVIVTPHVAGVTYRSYMNMAALVAENVQRIVAGLEPKGALNSWNQDS